MTQKVVANSARKQKNVGSEAIQRVARHYKMDMQEVKEIWENRRRSNRNFPRKKGCSMCNSPSFIGQQ